MQYYAIYQYSINPLFHYSKKALELLTIFMSPLSGAVKATSLAAGIFDGRGFFIVLAGERWSEDI